MREGARRRLQPRLLGVPAALVLVGIVAAVVSVAGDGPDLPDDAVARVADRVITKAEFDQMATRSPVGTMGVSGGRRVYDPPAFTACVAAKKANRPTETTVEQPPDQELKRRCENEFSQLRGDVMNRLLEDQWLRLEARRLGVPVPRGRVQRQLQRYLTEASPAKRAEFELGVGQIGSRRAVIDDLQADQLEQRVVQKVYRRAPATTEADVRRYHARKAERFVAAERRDLRAVLALDRTTAEHAQAALARGDTWTTVANKYSADDQTRARGGLMRRVERGQLEPDLDRAVFAARVGSVEGPLDTQFGWYVFEVTRVTGARPRSLDESRREIRTILRDRRRERMLKAFNRGLAQRYEPKTICADEYKVANCANG